MAQPTQNTTLSLPTRLLLYLGPPAIVAFTAYVSPRTGLLAPLAFVPTAIALRAWHQENKANPSKRGELQPMVWTFAGLGTVGLVAVMLAQMALFQAATALIFGTGERAAFFVAEFQRSTIEGMSRDELAKRALLAASWQNWLMNFLVAFGMAGLLEEILKVLPVIYARQRGTADDRKPRTRQYLDYALAGSLSFGVIENIAFLYEAVEGAGQTSSKLLVTALERLVFASAGHLLAAALSALRATRKDYYGDDLSWWDVIRPSVLLHGSQNFIAFSSGALEGSVGWMHPTGLWTQ